MEVCIIGGNGKFGDFFKTLLAFQTKEKVNVSVIGRDNYDSLQNFVKNADLIIISVPISATEKIYKDLSALLSAKQAVIDLSSSMSLNQEKLKSLPSGSAFLHPLFAPTLSNYKGLSYVLVEINKSQVIEQFVEIIKSAGSKVISSDLESHEKIMAFVQALAHFNSILFAKTLAESGIPSEKIEEYSTTFFRLDLDTISRIFAQKPEIYAQIQFDNSSFLNALEGYSKSLKEMEDIVSKKDMGRYEEIFNQVNKSLGPLLKDSFIESQSIINSLPKSKIKVGFLGPSGSFSERVALISFPSDQLQEYERIKDVVKAVHEGQIDFGIVPIENSIEGTVTEAIDAIFKYKLFITKSLVLPIHHCCAALSKKANHQIVLSHPQGLAQCSEFIEKNYPNAKVVQTLSTAQAFKKIADENLLDAVAIGPAIAAEKYHLEIISKNIENKENNQTRFAIISKKFDPVSEGTKTSIVLSVTEDRPGLLFDILKSFKEASLNLSKLESRPSKKKLGTYVFHIDIDANYGDTKLKEALKKISKEADVTFLGCYKQEVIND